MHEIRKHEDEKVSRRKRHIISEYPLCPICKIKEDSPFVQLTVCKHIFHKECIAPWFKTQRICPYCTQEGTDHDSYHFIVQKPSRDDDPTNEEDVKTNL